MGLLELFNPPNRRSLLALGLCFMTLLAGYPLARAVTTALFLEYAGARQSPHVWLLTVLVLFFAVWLLNKTYKRDRPFRPFALISLISAVGLIGMTASLNALPMLVYPLYVLKEVYIVLLVHLTIARMNNLVTVIEAKKYYGPFGALGSLGGIGGGFLTHRLAPMHSSLELLCILGLFLLMATVFFWKTQSAGHEREQALQPAPEKSPPLSSLAPVRVYVLGLIGLIILSQFVVNIANFQFNLLFDVLVSGVQEKTQFLGLFYGVLNGLSLALQIIAIPLLFRFMKMQTVHICIPLLGLVACVIGFGPGAGLILGASGAFMVVKALDYSIFSAAKEILYFPLSVEQKYGAKYLVDMVFYRFAKGLISFVLIFMQEPRLLNIMLFISFGLWIALVYPVFLHRSKLLKENL
jgi:ATP:ADP antiporter, AAA family